MLLAQGRPGPSLTFRSLTSRGAKERMNECSPIGHAPWRQVQRPNETMGEDPRDESARLRSRRAIPVPSCLLVATGMRIGYEAPDQRHQDGGKETKAQNWKVTSVGEDAENWEPRPGEDVSCCGKGPPGGCSAS